MRNDEETKGCQLPDMRKEMSLRKKSDANLHTARYSPSLLRTSGGFLRHYLPPHYEKKQVGREKQK